MITHDELKRLLHYDPESGVFTHLVARQRVRVGSEAGGVCSLGYRRIKLNRMSYFAHRLAWFYVHGVWPTGDLDHIDGDPRNNRISNLREASRAENLWNQRISKNNTSGHHGVTRRGNRWIARLMVNRRYISLGSYSSAEEAAAARRAGEIKYHGEFAAHVSRAS